MRFLRASLVTVAVVTGATTRSAYAQSTNREAGFTSRTAAPLSVYADVTTIVLTNSVGASVDYRPLRGLGVSAGFGGFFTLAAGSGYGGQAMVHGFFGAPGPHAFEVAAGLSVMSATRLDTGVSVELGSDLYLSPSGFLGYRFQRLDGGLLFRGGLGLNYGLGLGVDLSLGYGF